MFVGSISTLPYTSLSRTRPKFLSKFPPSSLSSSSSVGTPQRLHADFSQSSFAGYMSDAESPIIPRIIRDLGPFLLDTSEDILSLVLETISVLSGVANGSWFTTDLAEALTAALLNVWPKNIKGRFYWLTHAIAYPHSHDRSNLLVCPQ